MPSSERHLARALVPEHLDDGVVLGEAQPLQQRGHRQLVRPFGQIPFEAGLFVHVGGMVGAAFDKGRIVRLVGVVLLEVG